MESIIARALEYTLKYWMKSFSRDQFKLQGRTAQLSNLDINGDALHASIGLPPAITVTTAKVGKLEIILPSLSNVQVEPIVVKIDRLDLVLEENDNVDASKSLSRQKSSTAKGKSNPAKSNGYGYADKIADGMTLEVGTVNLLLETHGGMRHKGGASWAPPMASITIRNLLLYTTNENWQVVNLKEARDFASDEKFIFVFKKLEWESLSIDLLPHPDMFTDANFDGSGKGSTKKDEDGANRAFFGGERFIEGISGEAHITIQRTELNSPLGLEVQLHITEAVCPAISEPGLRALLRFLTGIHVCLNRGDVNPNNQQSSTEAAGRSLVSVVVDHIFLCIKDTEFQLELLMQSLSFSRTSVSDGENAKYLTRIMISGLFLRDTFSRPPCALVQPMMDTAPEDILSIPEFAENFCPPIHPLGDPEWKPNCGVPLLCLHSLQLKPSPTPPIVASQSVIECQPLVIYLQEESCLRIASFLADGIVVNPGAVLPEFSINTLTFNLKGLDANVPLELGDPNSRVVGEKTTSKGSFTGARLRVEELFYHESPSLCLRLLNLEKDPACFSFWEGQPVDASQKKLRGGATLVSISLENCLESTHIPSSQPSLGLGRCVDLKDLCLEVAMATADGSPLKDVPPPGGIVRIGVAFQQFLSNTSVEQLFLILDLYSYLGTVSEKIAVIGKNNPLKELKEEESSGSLMDKAPGDTAVTLAVNDIQLRFLESSSEDEIRGVPLVQFVGKDILTKVTHRTLGGAMAISSNLRLESIEVDCADTCSNLPQDNGLGHDDHQLRSVLWVQNQGVDSSSVKSTSGPFLDVNLVHVIPYNAKDKACHSLNVSACITGLRLGGGMNHAEALLHRFGILGPDGGPGEGLTKGLEHLSAGPLSKLLKPSPSVVEKDKIPEDEEDSSRLKLGTPDDLDVSIELNDWLFALEGEQELAQNWWFGKPEDAEREERSWHTTFRSVCVKTKGNPKNLQNGEVKSDQIKKFPVDLITVGVVGLQILKPLAGKSITPGGMQENGLTQRVESCSGVNFDVDIVTSADMDDEMPKWVVENIIFSVKEPIEAVVTKDELEYLTILCKSEVDSMGRITAGVLRLLKLESSIGSQAISQLSNLGSESFDNIFSPQKLSRGSSASSIGPCTTSGVVDSGRSSALGFTVSSLEEVMLEAQAKCAALSADLSTSTTSSSHLDDHVKDLRQKLASMQKLLQHMRSQI